MAHPTPKVEIAFSDGPFVVSPTWTDVTSYVIDATVSRGRSSDREPFGQSHASVKLNNADREFDPMNLDGPYVEAATPEQFNYVLNPLFELNGVGWYGYNFLNNEVATVTDPFGSINQTSFYAETDPSIVCSVEGSMFPVTASTAYTTSVYVKRRSGTGGTVQIEMLYFDSGLSPVSSAAGTTVNLSGSWQRVTFTHTVPSTAAWMYPSFIVTSTSSIPIDFIYPMSEQGTTASIPWFAPFYTLPLTQSVLGSRPAYEFLGESYGSTMRRIPYAARTLLRPRIQIRITADPLDGSGYRAVFKGFVSGFPVSYTMAGKNAMTTLDCFDLFGLLAVAEVQPDWAAKFWGFGYRGNDPEGSTTISWGGSTEIVMRQVSGSTPFRTIDSLAPNLPHKAISIGAGNVWRSTPRTPITGGIGNQGIEIGMWWAKGVPSTASTPFVVGTNNLHYEFHVTAAGQLRVRIYNKTTNLYEQALSTLTDLNSFTARHIMLTRDFFPPFGVSTDPVLYIDGQNVTSSFTSGNAGASPYSPSEGLWEQVGDDVFQEFYWRLIPYPASFPQANVTDIYGVAVDKVTESTSARFTRIMQQTSVPSAWRTFSGTAEATVSAIGMGGAVSPQLDTLCESEGGHLFVSKGGVLTMTHRGYAASKASGTPAAIFNDQGANLRYGKEFSVEHTADEMLNEVQVNYSSEGSITVSNATSKSLYGALSDTLETQLSTQQGAIDLATYTRTIYGSVIPRVSALEVSVANTAAHWATILDMELLDAFSFTAHPSTGTTISQKMTVQQIEHRITPKIWETSIRGSSRFSGWFVLDQSALDGPDVML